VVAAAGGKVRALAGFGPAGDLDQPTFSPDGSTFTVTGAVDRGGVPTALIYRYNQRSGTIRRLVAGGWVLAPLWSPRSDAFLIVRRHGGRFSLERIDAETGADDRVVPASIDLLTYSWSADAAKIAYAVSKSGRNMSFVIDRDGRNRRLLAVDALDPALLPGDRRFVYWAPSSRPDRMALKIGSLGGRGQRPRIVPGGPFLHPMPSMRALDRSRRRILLLRPPRGAAKSDYGDGDLVVQEIDAASPAKVIARNVIPVSWSPGADRILILRPRDIGGETVFLVSVIDPDRRSERAVAVIDEQDINGGWSFPAWKRGGQHIAATRGEYAPQARVNACAPRIERLRTRLAR